MTHGYHIKESLNKGNTMDMALLHFIININFMDSLKMGKQMEKGIYNYLTKNLLWIKDYIRNMGK